MTRATISSIQPRARVLQASPVNARLWALIAAAQDLRDGIADALDEIGDDAAKEVLTAGGLDVPYHEPSPFGAGTYAAAIHHFDRLREALDECLLMAPCDLPPPPAEPENSDRDGAPGRVGPVERTPTPSRGRRTAKARAAG